MNCNLWLDKRFPVALTVLLWLWFPNVWCPSSSTIEDILTIISIFPLFTPAPIAPTYLGKESFLNQLSSSTFLDISSFVSSFHNTYNFLTLLVPHLQNLNTWDYFPLLNDACWLSDFSHFWFFVIPWTVARQPPLLMGFSRQEGLPCPPPGDRTLISGISCIGRQILYH